MRPIHLILIFSLFIVSCQSDSLQKPADQDNPRKTYNFNSDWLLALGDIDSASFTNFDDQSWQSVTLPNAWNEKEAFRLDIKDLSTGIAWYRKHFTIPTGDSKKKIFIEFEGVRQAAQVYVNGDSVGLHENGVMAFGFDITDYLNPAGEENIIAVRVDNDWNYREQATGSKYQWSNKNFNVNYGGITKNVTLHVTNHVYQTLPLYSNLGTTGQYIYAENIDVKNQTATITAQTQVKNELKNPATLEYEVLIEDLEGKIIKSFQGKPTTIQPGATTNLTASDNLSDLNFWSWGYGYLHKVHTVLKSDGELLDWVTTTTGFRKTAFEDGLFKLNDRVAMLTGYAQRTTNEWPAVGVSVPPWLSDYSNRLMVESNGKLVRWMHVTPSKQDVESCDRVGLIQAMPAGDSEGDVTGRRWEHRLEVMRDAIIYNRNNPSIIFYESGNEEISEEHMSEMKDIRDAFDPMGGRAIGSREMLDSEVSEYGGEMLYINKSDRQPVWAMEYMRDEGLRKYWDEYSPPYHINGAGPLYKGREAKMYNQNQDAYAYQIVRRWFDYFRERPGTGKRVSSGGVNIVFSDTNTHHRGSENYRRSGETDPMRIPKDGFYAHQVIWNGWVEVENHQTHIVGHWNYTPETTKDIYVVSSGNEVELFLNGESLGTGENEFRFLYIFKDVSWQSGTLKAVSYNKAGEVLSEDLISTTGEPAAVRLSLIQQSPNGMLADGLDLALIEAEIIDKNGNRCPTALNMLDFEIEGPAEWRGGIAQGPDNYILSKSLPVECGVNRVFVKSTTVAGTIKVSVKSEGLESSEITFDTNPVEVTNGLSSHFADSELPSNLEKGPTPVDKPNVIETRRNINIISATAGANQEQAFQCFDGKQSTRWRNDGQLETGWISLQLEREAPIDQIALKLSGWRTRSYPIVVEANDEIIYRGITEPNLGFFYIHPKKSISTDQINIRLFGQTEYQDAYKLVEITGKLDKETANDRAVQDATMLNIAEIEVFEFIEN